MKLEDAIEILTDEQKDHHSFPTDIIGRAELLLIEAGKYIIYRDNCPGVNTRLLLPGETEE